MTTEEIKKYVEQISQNAIRRNTQKAYHSGNHVALLQPEAKPNPDVRAPVPFARKSVALIKGYMAKPGNIVYQGSYYDSTLQPIYDYNDEQLTTADELEDCLIHGVCYELHWMDESSIKQFYPVPVEQGMPIFSDSLKPELIGFIWHRVLSDKSEIATYYDATTKYDFTKEKDAKAEWKTGDESPHGYGVVPINIGKIDRDYRNLFDHVLPLIDLYDKLISEDVGNELQRFNNAIMLMAERIDTTSTDDDGRTMVDRLKEMRLIDGLSPDGSDVRGKVAFATRDVPTAFLEFSAKQVERLIYEMLMIVNPNDDSFATASGIAQAYKLLAMEYLCAGIESYFSRFLQNRIKIISGLTSELGDSTDGMDEVTIEFKRNLPHNLAEIADVMSKLNGLVSEETLIGLLPNSLVPDIEAELKRKAESVASGFDAVESVSNQAEEDADI
jgi:SPP1 family phage portal protein